MKRSLVIVIPLLLLILLNACDINAGALPPYSNAQWTAIAMTQQVMTRPHNERIRNLLNTRTSFDKFDELEQRLVGKYEVMSVVFPSEYFLEVDMNCECASGSDCCDPERMFFITLQRMALSRDQILAEVPADIQTLDVVCFDHKFAIAAMYAPWDTVKKFLTGVATASDLSSSITRKDMP